MIATQPSRAVPAEPAAVTRHAVFSRQGQLFGLSIELVREVLPGQPLTRVPRAADQILGVLSLRGEILPVVVIDSWLGLPPASEDPHQPILVLRRADLLVGLRVDAIRSVLSVPAAEVQAHPSAASDSLLTGIWHPPGMPPVTLIAGVPLLETLCRQAATAV